MALFKNVLDEKSSHLTHDSRFIRALYRQPVDRLPIWFMRQAGRYLPEYQKVRSEAGDFLTLCQTPELACQVTLQPLHRFPLDAAIIFSDILTIPDAMGLELEFLEGKGPYFKRPLLIEKDILELPSPDPEQELRYVMDAIRLTRSVLDPSIPLIGFSGSPWTLATYMLEGQSSKDYRRIREWLYQNPQLLHHLLSHLTNCLIEYLHAQVKAGASVLMIFDTWGGLLTKPAYLSFSLFYLKKIVKNLKKVTNVPVILFTKNGGLHLSEIADSGCDAIGLDWQADLTLARSQVGHRCALQGNLDPMALHAPHDRLREEIQQVLAAFGEGAGHIFNLGHGILPETDPDKVAFAVHTVQEISAMRHMYVTNGDE